MRRDKKEKLEVSKPRVTERSVFWTSLNCLLGQSLPAAGTGGSAGPATAPAVRCSPMSLSDQDQHQHQQEGVENSPNGGNATNTHRDGQRPGPGFCG